MLMCTAAAIILTVVFTSLEDHSLKPPALPVASMPELGR